jgi:hypothetical protein
MVLCQIGLALTATTQLTATYVARTHNSGLTPCICLIYYECSPPSPVKLARTFLYTHGTSCVQNGVAQAGFDATCSPRRSLRAT